MGRLQHGKFGIWQSRSSLVSMASFRAHFASKPTTPALVNQEVQAAKLVISACVQSLERFGDDNPAVTMLTTMRNGAVVEHAVPVRTCKPLLAFPRDYLVIPARVLTAAALLFLPLVTAACLVACAQCLVRRVLRHGAP